MNLKRNIKVLILVTAALLTATFLHKKFEKKEQVHTQRRELNVIYFYGNDRCEECLKIEEFTTQAIENLKSDKSVTLRTINMDLPANSGYKEHYKLSVKTVVLSLKENGKEIRWKRLDKVWKLLNDQEKFTEYIYKEIEELKKVKNI